MKKLTIAVIFRQYEVRVLGNSPHMYNFSHERVKNTPGGKRGKTTWTGKKRSSPLINQLERTGTDKASCELTGNIVLKARYAAAGEC